MGSSVYNKYPQTFDFNGKKVLNLGCGFAQYKRVNVINLDGEECSGADVVWDLSKTPLPFEDDTFDLVLANHIFEHVPNWWDCFEDCSRIIKTGGHLEIWVPGAGADSVLGFRDHLNTINHCSFWGTYGLARNPGNAWAMSHSNGKANLLKLKNQHLILKDRPWIRYSPKFLQGWYAEYLRNVIFEMGFVFKKMAKPEEVIHLEAALAEAII